MAIEVAVQRGGLVSVVGSKNRQLFSKSGDLHGYTGSSVSIKRGNVIYTYNDRGGQIGAKTA